MVHLGAGMHGIIRVHVRVWHDVGPWWRALVAGHKPRERPALLHLAEAVQETQGLPVEVRIAFGGKGGVESQSGGARGSRPQ